MKKLKEIFGSLRSNEEEKETMEVHSGCCGGGSHEHGQAHQHNHEGHSNTKYQCPMKCEGGKTYNTPGDCPVCNMHLVAAK